MDALSTLFARFLRERRFLKNVTPKTVIWYETAFQALTRTVVVAGPDDLSKAVLQDFVVGLRERGLSPVSCNTYGKAINAFLVWLHTEGHLAEALSLPPQRTETRVVRTLSDEHLKRLLGFKPKTAAQWRAYALANPVSVITPSFRAEDCWTASKVSLETAFYEAAMATAQDNPVAFLESVIATEEMSRGRVKRFKGAPITVDVSCRSRSGSCNYSVCDEVIYDRGRSHRP